MRKFPLTKAGAGICARAFVSSVRTAGFMTPDGTIGSFIAPVANDDPGDQQQIPIAANRTASPIVENLPGTHTHTLPLANQRKVTINAPLDITPSEISRLKAWAEVTLLVEWHEKDAETGQ